MHITTTTCSWCHTGNTLDRKYCQQCGHEAHVSRMACQCPDCMNPPALPTEQEIADLLAYFDRKRDRNEAAHD